ncbi:MAG: EAL domain-containing protein [Halothiobacillaceae bacterium]
MRRGLASACLLGCSAVSAADGPAFGSVDNLAWPWLVGVTALLLGAAGLWWSQRQARRAAERDRDLLRNLVDAVDDPGFVVFDRQGAIRLVSRGTCSIFGFADGGPVGRSVLTLFDLSALRAQERAEGEPVTDELAALFGTLEPDVGSTIDRVGLRADGSRFDAELCLRPMQGPAGRGQSLLAIRDVTEARRTRRRLERNRVALERARRRLRAASADARLGHWERLEDSDSLIWSDEVYDLFGLSRGRPVLSADFIERVHPEDRDAVIAMENRLTDSSGRQVVEYRFRARDGRWHWAREVASFVREPGERLGRLVGTVQDITELKTAELAARESEMRFRRLFEDAPVALMIFDPGTAEVIDANTRALASYGVHSLDDLHAMPIWDGGDAYGPVQARRRMQEAVTAGAQVFEWASANVRGEVFWESVHLSPIQVDGQLRVMSAALDITDRKRAERDLEELRNRLQATLDAIPDMLFEVSAEGRILRVHTADPDALLHEPGVFLDRHYQDILPADVAGVIDKALRQAATQGVAQGWQYAMAVHGDWRHFDLSVSRKPQPGDGAWEYVCLVRDVTDRVRATEVLDRRTHELGERLKELRCLLGLAEQARDAQTPLAEFLARVVGLLPPAWQYPERTWACLYWRGQEYEAGAREGEICNRLEQPIRAGEGAPGSLVVAYRGPGDCAFLDEEHDLLAAFADQVSVALARREDESRMRLLAQVVASSYDGIMVTDADNRIIEVNPALLRLSGYAREELLGRSPAVLSSGRHDRAFYARMWSSVEANDFWRGEVWNRRKDGSLYAQMLSITVMRDEAGRVTHHIGVSSDISQLKEHENELARIANHDALTGLPNRRLLQDRLQQAIERARRYGSRLAVCFLDLDGFKPINDCHGHEIGDQLLVRMSHRLSGMLRASDTLARLGGDEFVLLIGDLHDADEIEPVASRLLDLIATPVSLTVDEVRVSGSVGVALYPDDGEDSDILLRRADLAMYRAKSEGKNRYCRFASDKTGTAPGRFGREVLAEAIAQSQFLLYYQPKVDLDRAVVFGAEALVRWQHPQQGLLSPAQFLDEIGAADLEVALGEWVITRALAQQAQWREAGLEIDLSINVSARHLLDERFESFLAEALAAHPAVPPESIELEILETAALANVEAAAATLIRCRKMGVRFSLDDFGTGYSSLSYLRALPVDMLKIDQSFVRDMLDDPSDLSIVEGVIGLGDAFNRGVIAEGVETDRHADTLQAMGCPRVQGFGIARPMSAESLVEWLAEWGGVRVGQGQPATAHRGVRNETDRLVLKVAEESYRRWIGQLFRYLESGENTLLPNLDPQQCSFGRWYHGAGQARFGWDKGFRKIDALHERVHQLASDLVAAHAEGQAGKCRDIEKQLRRTHRRVVSRLATMRKKLQPADDGAE